MKKKRYIKHERESKHRTKGEESERGKILLSPAIDSSQALLPLYFAFFSSYYGGLANPIALKQTQGKKRTLSLTQAFSAPQTTI